MGKTGLQDEAVLLDRCFWIYPRLKELVGNRQNLPQRLWPFPSGDLQKEFAQQVQKLRLGALGAPLYSLRHGVASDDLLSGRRCLAEAQRRGRWKSSGSLARYAKETRMLAELLRHGVTVETHIVAVISLRRRLAPPA